MLEKIKNLCQKIKSKISGTLILVLVLATVASALIVWKIFLAPKQPTQPEIIPTPIPAKSRFALTPTPILEEKGTAQEEILESLREDFPLVDHVPYRTEEFIIDYIEPFHLKVFLKKDSPNIREKVLDWIEAKGVDPESHQIDWVTPEP